MELLTIGKLVSIVCIVAVSVTSVMTYMKAKGADQGAQDVKR